MGCDQKTHRDIELEVAKAVNALHQKADNKEIECYINSPLVVYTKLSSHNSSSRVTERSEFLSPKDFGKIDDLSKRSRINTTPKNATRMTMKARSSSPDDRNQNHNNIDDR